MTSPAGGGAGAAGAGSGVGGGMSAPTTSSQESPSSAVVAPEGALESLDSGDAGRLPGFAPTEPRTWTVVASSFASVGPGAETATNAAATINSTTRVTFNQRD